MAMPRGYLEPPALPPAGPSGAGGWYQGPFGINSAGVRVGLRERRGTGRGGARRDRDRRYRRYGLGLVGTASDAVDLGAVDGFHVQQHADQGVQRGAVAGEELDGALFGLAEQAGDLGVDLGLRRLGERAAGKAGPAAAQELRAALGVPDRAERLGQAELPDHLDRQVGRAGQVVGRAGGALADSDQFGGAAAEPDGQ